VRPEVKIFPPQDDDFRGEVEHALSQLTAAPVESAPEPRDLVALVCGHYPNVSIASRDEFGTLGSTRVVWYVFRDHRIRSDDARRERLYGALARARNMVSDSNRALGRSRSAATGTERRWGHE